MKTYSITFHPGNTNLTYNILLSRVNSMVTKKKKKKITLGRAAENSWNPDRTQTLVLKYYQ